MNELWGSLGNLFGGAGNQLGNFDMGSLASSIEGMTPAMQEQLGSMDIWGGMGEGAFGTGGQASGMGNLWGNLTSDKASNIFGIGKQGYDMYGQNKMMDFQKNLMNQQEARTADAYSRDVEADEARQALRF
ncbi:MAG: hypothetical protein GQ570_08585 [Helicobacteraceae bacterium]|nr:hypothetical protein [Helicobacteraceae bacterium]